MVYEVNEKMLSNGLTEIFKGELELGKTMKVILLFDKGNENCHAFQCTLRNHKGNVEIHGKNNLLINSQDNIERKRVYFEAGCFKKSVKVGLT